MGDLILKAKTRQEVADDYGICVKTLNNRLAKANIIVGPGLIFPKTLKIIYETFSGPKVLNNQPKRTEKIDRLKFILPNLISLIANSLSGTSVFILLFQ